MLKFNDLVLLVLLVLHHRVYDRAVPHDRPLPALPERNN